MEARKNSFIPKGGVMFRFNKNLKFYSKQKDARLKQLSRIKPFIAGSMVKIAHTCGSPNCKCATGEKHENYYLTYKIKQKTITQYIPVDLEEEVRGWTLEYKRVKRIMNEVSLLQRKILRQYGVEKKIKRALEMKRREEMLK
jgi:hypothetical protein